MNLNFDLISADSERRKKLFNGNLILYSDRKSVAALCEHARSMIGQTFGDEDSERAQFAMAVEVFVDKVGPLKSQFTNDMRTKVLIRDILQEFGCDLESTYFDVPRLRVVTHGGYLTAGVGYAYQPHRDMWYASPRYQVNWWTPVFDLTAERSMAFYPRYWASPIENTSSTFNYDEWCDVGRKQAGSQIKIDTRKHPLPTATIPQEDELRVECTTAQLIMFSGAHLHATAPNTSGLTRFSIDFRTINVDDISNAQGAPNIDSAATGTTLRDFLRAKDFIPLPEPLIPRGIFL